MPQAKKGRLNYRCPNCFKRDIDMDMFYDTEKHEYYCIRCCFHADEETVIKMNADIRTKYGHRMDRITSFNEDNEEVTYHPYKKGEL